MHRISKSLLWLLIASVLIVASAGVCEARKKLNKQTLYVPVYSHIYFGNRGAKINLTTTISIRNTSRVDSLWIDTVEYYDTEGKLIRTYLDKPMQMKPLQSIKYIIKLNDDTGGSGANFIVSWRADQAIDEPIVEAISLGTGASFGFSFLTDAVAIE